VATELSLAERRALVEFENPTLPISRQAGLLSLNRTGLYYQPRPPSAQEVMIKHRIDEIYTEIPFYGSRKITGQLRREGISTCRETVRQYMREMGLRALHHQPN
jgi:putative transposase